jgi:hypothetical protein
MFKLRIIIKKNFKQKIKAYITLFLKLYYIYFFILIPDYNYINDLLKLYLLIFILLKLVY